MIYNFIHLRLQQVGQEGGLVTREVCMAFLNQTFSQSYSCSFKTGTSLL